MDKKFIGIIALMLAACIIIISIVTIPKTTKTVSTTSSSSSTAYVKKYFDKNKVQEINIKVSEADYEDMMQNPTKEEYKEATVTVNGAKVDNVGFRVKGNSSLSSVAQSNSKRFSFKLDFDQYIDGQSLDGLTKLNLNNSFSDPSNMREYLSYSLLEQMGIPTPAYSYANVYVNGELVGLYLAVEGIEEPFLQRYYGSNYGNLYKPEGTGSDLVYIDDKIESYSGIAPVFDVKNGANESIIAMLKALNQGKDLEKYLNVDEILRYFAANTVLINMDSYLGSFKHNYYLYEQDGVFTILPWDYNMSFGGFGMRGGNSQDTTSLYIDQPVSGTALSERPLLGKLLEVPEYKKLYHQYIKEFINGPFSSKEMEAEIQKVAGMIRPYLEKDPTKFYTMEQFEQAIAEGAQSQNSETQVTTSSQADSQKQTATNNRLAQSAQKDAAVQGRRPVGGMMQGNTNMGLVKFVRDRITNVQKQLSGELPTAGTTTEQSTNSSNMPGKVGNQQNGQMPPDGRQRPDGMQKPDGNMQGPDQAGGNGGPGNMDGGGKDNIAGSTTRNISTQQMYLVGGSTVLLLVLLAIILKKKTKYSV